MILEGNESAEIKPLNQQVHLLRIMESSTYSQVFSCQQLLSCKLSQLGL